MGQTRHCRLPGNAVQPPGRIFESDSNRCPSLRSVKSDRLLDDVRRLYQHCITWSNKGGAIRATITSPPSARSARLGLRATPEQEVVLRRAAEVGHKSLTDFILDSACLAAEQTLLDQRLFMVSGSQYQALMDLLDRPAQPNEGLADLFSRKAPWDAT